MRLEDEVVPCPCPSIDSGRRFSTRIIAPGIGVSVDTPFGKAALRNSLLATEDRVEAERDQFLKDLNRFKVENEQLIKLIPEKDAAMKEMLTCVVNMKIFAKMESENRPLTKPNAHLL